MRQVCFGLRRFVAVGMMPVEARAEAGDPPKGLAPPVEDGPFLRPAEGTARGADLGYQGRHRHRALAEPWPARADPRLYALPRTASPHRDELHRCRTGGRAVRGAFPSSRRAASTTESQARRCGRPTCSRTFPSRVNLGAPPEAWSARRTVTERSPSSFPSSAFDNGAGLSLKFASVRTGPTRFACECSPRPAGSRCGRAS